MIDPTDTLSAADSAILLRSRLGPMRAWPDFLADCIRHKQHIKGHALLPCARQKGTRGFQLRYDMKEINSFVADVLRDEPEAGKSKLTPTTLNIDSAHDWTHNIFDRDGNPFPHAGKP